MTASWFVSCLLHVVLAIAAVSFVRHLQLAPQSEPFHWDIAVLAPLSSSVNSAPAAQPTTPPAPAIQSSTSPTKAMRQKLQPVESATVVESSSESYQEQLITNDPRSSSMDPALLTDTRPDIIPHQPSDTVREESGAPPDHSIASEESQILTDPTPAHLPSASHLQSARADYGWLSAIMAQWIEDLDKRYPAMLRTEGVQGKVTLAAILHDDGLLSDVRIVKSSGYAALDQVAVQDVQNGPPIGLFRPLGRSQMPVKFSISYDLTTAR